MPLEPRDLDHFAILLDVDGTLLDIAPTPQQVQVPDSLRRALAVLSQRVDGALALVSGRPLADLDAIFAPLRLPAIGGHGAELRLSTEDGAFTQRAKALDPGLARKLKEIAARHSGVTLEDKNYSIALHYRMVPDQGPDLVEAVRHAVEVLQSNSVELLTGKSVIEVKIAGFDKGTAVRELMKHPPFAGRAPIFIGDDKTDEAAFAVVPEFNGLAVSVGRKIPGIDDLFQSPADVRQWLERLSGDAVVPI